MITFGLNIHHHYICDLTQEPKIDNGTIEKCFSKERNFSQIKCVLYNLRQFRNIKWDNLHVYIYKTELIYNNL